MKDIKCPLCGTNSEYFLCEIGTNPYYATTAKLFGCPTCKIGFNHPDGWKEYVSKFPPIMRLRQGDNVLVWLSDDIHTVLGTDLASGKIHLQDVYGDADSYPPDGIKKWPWELEQKGGAEQ